MARRQHALHHNLQPGQNVIFHHEHRSKKGRKANFHERKRKLGYRVERKERIIERRVKQSMRAFMKGEGRLSMTA